LLAQKVSKTWHAVIQKSQQLQQALFFSPLHIDKGPLVVVCDSKSSSSFTFTRDFAVLTRHSASGS
jgi:hypothetical protein